MMNTRYKKGKIQMKQVKRCYYLTEKDIENLEIIKNKYALSSAGKAISLLITNEIEKANKTVGEEEKIAKAVVQELNDNYISKERLKWSLQTAEQNSIVILDVLNTLLFKEEPMDCISIDYATNQVITQSKERIKDKIAHFKQKSDERKAIQE